VNDAKLPELLGGDWGVGHAINSEHRTGDHHPGDNH
jgi:hypothetical protein